MPEKIRIDVYMCENLLAPSREKAKALIIAGEVYIDGHRCAKPSDTVSLDQEVTVKQTAPYVSRGGKKLEKAIISFKLDLNNAVAIDVGASTGGFTDCMLQNGAEHVYSVDVGHGQLAWKLRQDSRVTVMEKCNARFLTSSMFDRPLTFASIDVSFISLKLILPVLKDVLTPPYKIMALIKPQFEAGKDKVGKKGVVRDASVHIEVIEEVLKFAESIGLVICGLDFSPIKGPEGNIEYLSCFTNSGETYTPNISNIVLEAHESLK